MLLTISSGRRHISFTFPLSFSCCALDVLLSQSKYLFSLSKLAHHATSLPFPKLFVSIKSISVCFCFLNVRSLWSLSFRIMKLFENSESFSSFGSSASGPLFLERTLIDFFLPCSVFRSVGRRLYEPRVFLGPCYCYTRRLPTFIIQPWTSPCLSLCRSAFEPRSTKIHNFWTLIKKFRFPGEIKRDTAMITTLWYQITEERSSSLSQPSSFFSRRFSRVFSFSPFARKFFFSGSSWQQEKAICHRVLVEEEYQRCRCRMLTNMFELLWLLRARPSVTSDVKQLLLSSPRVESLK